MAYSDNFPTQRAVFTLDAANAGRLDPRCSFSRASTGTFFGTEKVLSSENLLPYSNNVSSSEWTKIRVTVDSVNNSSPDGGSDASLILETVDTGSHTYYDGFSGVSGQNYSFTIYAKANGRTKFILSPQATAVIANVEFDLTAVTATVTSGATVGTPTITAIGSTGWYKCAATVTATATGTGYTQVSLVDGSGNSSYAGDVTKGIYVWGHQVSSTGETVLNETSGSIHREYQTKLQTAASGAARFEHSATDGQSAAKGILIESASTNLATYSETLATGWTEGRSTLTAASGVAPDGTLTSNLFTVDGTAANSHNAYFEYASGGATPQTFSIFAKKGSANYIALRYGPTHGTFSDGYVFFDLSNGTKGTVTAAITASSIVDCGNGWYRCSITNTALQSGTARAIIYVAKEDNTFSFDGNSYDHIQVWGAQIEANQSFASSYIKSNSGSTTTRAADSMTVTDSSLFDNGDTTIMCDVTVPTDSGTASGGVSSRFFRLENSSAPATGENYEVYRNASGRIVAEADAGGANVASYFVATSSPAGNYKLAVRYGSDSKAYLNGAAGVSSDSAMPNPSGLDTLRVGNFSNTAGFLNGHCKRIAVFGEALSDSNLQAITS